jgi:hypothetical protein
MIKLDAAYIKAVTSVFDGVTSTSITDTLEVSYAEIDFVVGNVMAMVQRGTVINGVFTPNLEQLRIQLNADGTFASTDGTWVGAIPAAVAAGFVAQLTAGFQAFILGAGKVTGTQE